VGRFVLGNGLARKFVGLFCRSGRRICTTGLPGYLMLYGIAALRGLRRRLLRHAREMAEIKGWLARIAEVAPADYELAIEIARCQRLVKGYGDTHARGMDNFTRIMERLPAIRATPQPAQQLRTLIEAALADEHGTRLATALQGV
jgi:indolepyruvate ferredoxin oxidoreductase beta subunit